MDFPRSVWCAQHHQPSSFGVFVKLAAPSLPTWGNQNISDLYLVGKMMFPKIFSFQALAISWCLVLPSRDLAEDSLASPVLKLGLTRSITCILEA